MLVIEKISNVLNEKVVQDYADVVEQHAEMLYGKLDMEYIGRIEHVVIINNLFHNFICGNSNLITDYIDENMIYEIRDCADADSYELALHDAYVQFVHRRGWQNDEDIYDLFHDTKDKVIEELMRRCGGTY